MELPQLGAGSTPAGFRYDANGFLIGMRAVNRIETTFQPDQRNRLKQISSPPLTLTYAYTPGGNVASITDASSGEPFTLTYGYDGANRLISAQVRMPTGIETVQYVYDALGNRIKEAWTDARGAIDYSYLPGNYLVQRGSTSYSWGTYGQLILKDEQPNALGGETNYDYSARRLMSQVRVDGSPVAQFFYDAYGRRVKIVEGDTTTITLYSGNDIVYEVKTKPGQPTVTTKYLAINGKYLAKVVQEGTNPPQTYFYHTDLVGSVRAITDGQGQVVARFEYEPFGVTVQASGPLAGDEVHKFTGKPEDAAIDLYYFNARYYDPVPGRFTSRDPAASCLNWYLYCSNRPLAYFDPNGLWEKDGKGGWIAEENDTLWGLAVIVYGDGRRWDEIPYAGDPEELQVGERVMDPIVWHEMMKAVNDSQWQDYDFQHEEGGWIIDVEDGGYTVMRWPTGLKSEIRAAPMPPRTVAGFHVHPVSAEQGAVYGPSPYDIASVKTEAKHHYVLSPWNQTIYEIAPTADSGQSDH